LPEHGRAHDERFRSLREEPNRFAVSVGHPLMDVERVIANEGNVNIVERWVNAKNASYGTRLSSGR